MTDSKAASLILVAGAAGLGYWWYQLNSGKLAAPAVPGGSTGAPGTKPTFDPKPPSGPPAGRWRPPAKVIDPGGRSFPWPIEEMRRAWEKKPRPGWPAR